MRQSPPESESNLKTKRAILRIDLTFWCCQIFRQLPLTGYIPRLLIQKTHILGGPSGRQKNLLEFMLKGLDHFLFGDYLWHLGA